MSHMNAYFRSDLSWTTWFIRSYQSGMGLSGLDKMWVWIGNPCNPRRVPNTAKSPIFGMDRCDKNRWDDPLCPPPFIIITLEESVNPSFSNTFKAIIKASSSLVICRFPIYPPHQQVRYTKNKTKHERTYSYIIYRWNERLWFPLQWWLVNIYMHIYIPYVRLILDAAKYIAMDPNDWIIYFWSVENWFSTDQT